MKYEVWKNKKLYGYVHLNCELMGKYFILPYWQTTARKRKLLTNIKFKIGYAVFNKDYQDRIIRTIIDVTGKSKKDINILMGAK